ncbi:response regulator [Asanoa siamensis]|uniref:response regulator n=1 Tax=Asanoa siamensis TaxID=926357 RepID=UPI0027E558F4|nr:response regulator [Asanoa siamensis]
MLRVLVVDDDDADAMMISEALEAGGAQVSIGRASDGQAALDLLRAPDDDAPRPDLILLDLNMPRMGGLAALAEIKSDDDLKAIPVVVLTTSDATSDVVNSYQRQANAYVTKPMELDAFEAAVAEINKFYRDVAILP